MKKSRMNWLIFALVVLAIGLWSRVAIGQNSGTARQTTTGDQTTTKPTGTISGIVTDESGRPLADANLTMSSLGAERSVKAEATDENGKFQFRNLAEGAYQLRVRSPGYVQPEVDLRDGDGLPRYFRTGENLSITLMKGGVITGTVTDQSGEPIVGIVVTAIRIRRPDDADSPGESLFAISRSTDDRGVYRIYGLRAGQYMVYASAGRGYSFQPSPFDRDAPTYYPSSTRDTASIVHVQTGQEATSIDIRYRNEKGNTVSGTISGTISKYAMLSLMVPGNLTPVAVSFSQEQDGRNSFSFPGVSSGDFKIIGYSSDEKTGQASSGSVSVNVRNSDVTGLVLKLDPLASISGRLTFEPATEAKCERNSTARPEHAIVLLRPEKKLAENLFVDSRNQAGVDANREFRLSGLASGNYRLRALLPTDDWYVKSIVRQEAKGRPNVPAPKQNSSPPELVSLNAGENLTGLILNVENGAGSISGQIKRSEAGEAMVAPIQLHLVPIEKERADDTLRYSQLAVDADGSFSFRNLAPGRYFLLSRAGSESESGFRPLAWDARERAALVRNAEATGISIEIKPCQAVRDLELVLSGNGLQKSN
jgi:hypothetical protein